jgi:hypothetical protein
MSHYKLINVTKQAGITKGRHKNGFFVSITSENTMGPGQHTIVENITPSILGMSRKGYIKIEEVKDIKVEIKKELDKLNAENDRKKRLLEEKLKKATKAKVSKSKKEAKENLAEVEKHNKESEIVGSKDKEEIKADIKAARNDSEAIISSGELGEDPMSDIEKANYTDGEPNFVVKADSKGKKGKSRNK